MFSISLVSEQKQARKEMQFIAVKVFTYLFTIFNYKVLLIWVKDRACLKIAIPAYCFNIFGSIFGVLFCLLIKKLILECKTVWKSMRKFPCAVWSVRAFPDMDKKKIFLKTAHCYGLIFFNYLFIRLENLKTSLNLATNFSEGKGINLRCVQTICTPFDS